MQSGTPSLYREVMRWPLWLFLLLTSLVASLIVAVWAALGMMATLVTTAVTGLILLSAYLRSRLPITVVHDGNHALLSVGGAQLETKFMGRVQPLEQKAYLRARRELVATAFFMQRFWVTSGVKIELDDPRDPTPYWLISCTDPERLCAILADCTRSASLD